MAADHLKIKSHERSCRQRYMEHNRVWAVGGPEPIMKFSTQQVESPPPKPPRRRYSDQISVSSLGTYSSNKKNTEEIQRGDLKLKRCNLKPAYLSLPTNLSANIVTEHKDSSNLLVNSSSLEDHIKDSKENEFYVKYFLENLKFSESSIKRTSFCNEFCNNEKLSFNHGIKNETLSKLEYDNFAQCTDKVIKNSTKNKTCMTSNCISQSLKSTHKDCHRRHHSDPAISHFNLQNDISVKCGLKQCCDNISHSAKASNYSNCIGYCSCCKNNYLIMQEASVLKEVNGKLWQHLCTLQNCLESMKKKTYDDSMDVPISGLLSSIYYAQKAKDNAMEERLRIALEERDAALQELDDLVHVLTKNYDFSDGEKELNKDVKDLIGEIRCALNPTRLLKYQRILLAQIDNLKNSKQSSLSHELRQATIERDNALEKVRKLEEDVKNMKICYDLWHSDNKHWEVTMFDVLNQVMQQRDTVLSKVDNGLDIGHIMYRSPVTNKFDSVEQNISPFEPRSKTIESLKTHQSLHLSDYQHSIATSDEVRDLKEEILLLNKALESEKRKREQCEGKCLKLERLIHILRKKLNGQNIGVPV